jgi:hypothetical protein
MWGLAAAAQIALLLELAACGSADVSPTGEPLSSTVVVEPGITFDPPPADASPKLAPVEAYQEFAGGDRRPPEDATINLGLLTGSGYDHRLVWAYWLDHQHCFPPTGVMPSMSPRPVSLTDCRWWQFLDANNAEQLLETTIPAQ